MGKIWVEVGVFHQVEGSVRVRANEAGQEVEEDPARGLLPGGKTRGSRRSPVLAASRSCPRVAFPLLSAPAVSSFLLTHLFQDDLHFSRCGCCLGCSCSESSPPPSSSLFRFI